MEGIASDRSIPGAYTFSSSHAEGLVLRTWRSAINVDVAQLVKDPFQQ